MNPRAELWKQIGLLSSGLLVSIIIGFMPPFTVAEQILFSVCTFVAWSVLDLIWLIGATALRNSREYEVWCIRNECDRELSNIRHYFAEIARIAHGKRDLFVFHFMKEFHNLAQRVKDAAEKQELRTASDFYLKAEDIFESFLGDPNPVLRYTWPVRDEERLFVEPAWWRFFEVTSTIAERKQIKGVCAVLILDTPVSVNQPRIKRLLDFFKTNTGQECRYILRETYMRICRENSIATNFLDFGIYGDRMLFRSEQYEPEYIGVYTKDLAVVQSYSRFFDTIWTSEAVMFENPSTATDRVKIKDLIRSDSDDEPTEHPK